MIQRIRRYSTSLLTFSRMLFSSYSFAGTNYYMINPVAGLPLVGESATITR